MFGNRAPGGTQLQPAPAAPATPARTHVVKNGDTLSSIAQQRGVSLQALIGANPQIRNP
ncbi:MAG: LysM domain-containing protein, partial [Pseudomonadota bacterium]|nr:LysM domain-containing protein [Pseudomonadota bacterium]